MTDSSKIFAFDLTQRPPRSFRCRLGGYVILPRMLDKGRATIAGINGEFHYDCPIDQHILDFLGINAAELREQLAADKSDSEILKWINANAKHKSSPWEIEQWSSFQERRGPDSDAETLQFFTGRVGEFSKTREDIRTFADLLDLDDYVTFDGKP
jgi:hypothetical protein